MGENARTKYHDLFHRLVANSTPWPEELETDQCWLWHGHASKGYGRIGIYVHHLKKGYTVTAHRVMFALRQIKEKAGTEIDNWIDAILEGRVMGSDSWPELDLPPPRALSEEDQVFMALVALRESGLEVDHTCVNSLCINPDHLQAVTTQQNIQLRDSRKDQKIIAETTVESDQNYQRLVPHFVGITALRPEWSRKRGGAKVKEARDERPQAGLDFSAAADHEARPSAQIIPLVLPSREKRHEGIAPAPGPHAPEDELRLGPSKVLRFRLSPE